MRSDDTNEEAAETLGLRGLAWTIADDDRAGRLLALTGLDGAALRARLGEPAVLAAVLGFLEAHKPDLVACADALGTTPAALVRAREALEARA
jgi:hypothetical protein